MKAAKRQRVQHPTAPSSEDEPPSPISAAQLAKKASYNGRCCGGTRIAGDAAFRFLPGEEAKVALAKQAQACWTDDIQGILFVTKCGKCKKMIFPTKDQKDMMKVGKSIQEAAQLLHGGITVEFLDNLASLE